MSDTPEPEKTDEAKPEPEPIDADFEPADDKSEDNTTATREKSGVGIGTVAVSSITAALAGGAIGVVGSGSSGIDTAKFARAEVAQQVTALEGVQEDLNTRLQKVTSTLSQLEAKSVGESERVAASLDAREAGESQLKAELDALTSQLDTILGVGSSSDLLESTAEVGDAADEASSSADTSPADAPTPATTPQMSPLQRLATRLARLETRLDEEQDAPSTNAQVRRSIKDLTDRIAATEKANVDLERALDNRADALASLQTGLFTANKAISDLEDRILRMSSAAPGATGETKTGELDALRDEIEALKQSMAPASAIASQPKEEADETASSESSPTETPAPVPTAVADPVEIERKKLGEASLALAQLKTDSARGKPFPSAWDRLAKTIPDNESLSSIRQISRNGAPSVSTLAEEFASISEPLLKAEASETKGDGWDWARKAFGGVVNVRKTDETGDSFASRINRASKALDQNDLSAAMEDVAALEGDSKTALKDWLKDARARDSLDKAMATITQSIMTRSQELSEEG